MAYATGKLSVGLRPDERSLGSQLPQKIIKQGCQLRETLQSLGLFKANGRETLRGFVTAPCVDADGNVIGIRGFKIDQHASGPATILVGADDSSRHSPSAVTNAECTVASAASPAIKTESGEGYGTRSVPTTIDEIILQDNELIFQRSS